MRLWLSKQSTEGAACLLTTEIVGFLGNMGCQGCQESGILNKTLHTVSKKKFHKRYFNQNINFITNECRIAILSHATDGKPWKMMSPLMSFLQPSWGAHLKIKIEIQRTTNLVI